jgi:ATP-dependent helicase HrpB
MLRCSTLPGRAARELGAWEETKFGGRRLVISGWALKPRRVTLPIHEALPALKSALAGREAAVLVAPPGRGQDHGRAPGPAGRGLGEGGKIVMLEPRRLAARAAASRMAQSLGESVGETVGFRVRLQSKVSARTRIEVVTEGVFTRMILDDPGLDGVAAVIFDEFHERSLDADLGLAWPATPRAWCART